MTSRPARPRALLNFISWPILKGVAPTGTLKRIFTGKSGPEQEKNIGRVIYASETFQNCKRPTGHIDTLSKGVIVETTHCSGEYLSTIFIRPKKLRWGPYINS